MDGGAKAAPEDNQGPSKEKEEDRGLEWLLKKEASNITPIPMDSNVLLSSDRDFYSNAFMRDRVFKAASQGDGTQLAGLLDYLRVKGKRLTSPDFTDKTNGKTALLKALLNLKDDKNETIPILLDIAEKTGDLEQFINAAYTDSFYKGQTALHVAIERRSFDYVKLLVEKGADVQAKAHGTFFQHNSRLGFYFGELPLSLAACTNQPEIVSFLMKNHHKKADVTDKDSQGNTVLHTLVFISDNTTENTEIVAKMYDEILIQHSKLQTTGEVSLESLENNAGFTPLKFAAKLGRIGLFRHMLNREIPGEETPKLSRKFTEWVYGPVHSSLYDMSSIDTDEDNSVLEIIVFGSEIPNRPEMLQIEPLRSLLQDKWRRFASKVLLMNFVLYLIYVAIFTTVASYRRDGQPPFPIENNSLGHLRLVGEIICVLGAARFLYKTISIFRRNPPTMRALFTDGFSEILFFLQASLLLICGCLYLSGLREYVGVLVLSLALAWMNVLHYTRGSKTLGIYNVMMQRMILGDLLQFLCVYSVLLFGFSAAIITLIDDSPEMLEKLANDTVAQGRSPEVETFRCRKPSYNNFKFTLLEMFKFTIGMGDLEFTDHVQNKPIFYILLISYITLTYILMLNMLIALMGNTVERISEQSETIWNLQRAFTILDIERSLPGFLKSRLRSKVSEMVCFRNDPDGPDSSRRFVRVTEINWKKWRSNLGVKPIEDPVNHIMKVRADEKPSGNRNLLERIRSRRHQLHPNNII